MVTARLARDGYVVLPYDADVARWAQAAHVVGCDVAAKGGDVRHGGTWFIGVDALPNAPDGSVCGVPLPDIWRGFVPDPLNWHRAQLSVVYPGYPQQDVGESDTAHRFRKARDAAHVDGLIPDAGRRYLREPHMFVLGLPLNTATASPLVVWRGSHLMMGAAFATLFAGIDPKNWAEIDVTTPYKAARSAVFAQGARIEIHATPGHVIVLHRHLLHGVAPWGDGAAPPEGRMMAYFRPQYADMQDWL